MRHRFLLAVAGFAALVGATNAVAEDATGIVGLRQATMKTLGAHMGALKAILTDQTQMIDQVALHAHAVGETAKLIPSLFPEGSVEGKTAALPIIWEQKADFDAKSGNLTALAAALGEAAKGGDVQATLAAFGKMGKEGCGGCHQTYRKKDS